MEETKPLTKLSLLKSLLSPATFPHLLMLALASIALFVLARMEAEVWSAYGFIGFSVAYLCLAPLSKNERIGGMLRYNTDDDSNDKPPISARFKILIVPIILGFVFVTLIYVILSQYEEVRKVLGSDGGHGASTRERLKSVSYLREGFGIPKRSRTKRIFPEDVNDIKPWPVEGQRPR